MKKILYLILIISIIGCKSEKNKSDLSTDSIEHNGDPIQPIQRNPEFKYGLDSISNLIYTNMDLTDEKGTVWISIKIDSIGNIEKTEITKSENEKLNSEALRLAGLIPNDWKPAELGPKRTKISSRYNFPIKFDKAVKILYAD